jgi:uncharacterized repeat protein (TIGR01451 family)
MLVQAPPLMYVRIAGPAGTKLTVYRGSDDGKTLELPATLGFRPGYTYRFALHEVPGIPRQVFYPTLDVRGSLLLTGKARNADFPATIHVTEDELQRVVLNTYFKKVVALERPDLAVPVATKSDQPLEVAVEPTRDPYVEAAQRGQPLVVFQIGQRVWTPNELNAFAIPGTVLLPGDRVLGTPKLPPQLPWACYQVYDPILGPRSPGKFTNIYDGGDSANPAGFDRVGRLKGLDPSDTIAEYVDSKGRQKLAASNRIHLCVPRFILFKSELTHAMKTSHANVGTTAAAKTPAASVGQLALKSQSQQQHSEGVDTKLRLSGNFASLSTSVFGRMQGLEVKSSITTVKAVEATLAGPQAPEPEDGPLLIIKWPEKTAVNVGDVVTFYLKYSNTGGQPITNVVVSDSLAARFEYVKGSTRTDRDALFTTQPNEVGSSVLRWEFTGPLQPREHGLISFQVRVR